MGELNETRVNSRTQILKRTVTVAIRSFRDSLCAVAARLTLGS